jgi:MFS family permease
LVIQTFSQIGSRMSGFAIGIWIFKQTGDATPLGLVAFFGTIPGILLGNVAGMFADRWDRRYVMTLSDSGQAIATLLLLLSFLSGGFQLWHLYVIAAFQSAFGAFLEPAISSSVTMLVPDNHRDRANAIRQLSGPAAGVIAPALASALYLVVGAAGVVLIDMISFVAAAVTPLLVQIPRPKQTDAARQLRAGILNELVGGFRYLWSQKGMLALVLLASYANLAINGVMVLSTPYILARTNSEAVLGTVMSVMSVGAILGGLIMSGWGGTRPRIHTVMPSLIAVGLALAAYGMSRSPWTLGLSLFLMLFPIPFLNAASMSMLQIKVPPDLQGRVFAVVMQVAMVLTPVAYLIAGPLADRVFEPAIHTSLWTTFAPLVGDQRGAGMGLLALFSGLSLALLTALMYALPRLRHMERDMPDYLPASAEPEPLAVAQPEIAPASA